MTSSESSNRIAKAERLAALLVAWHVTSTQALAMDSFQWRMLDDADVRLNMAHTSRTGGKLPSEETRKAVLRLMHQPDRDFKRQLRELRRFARNETRRLVAAKENVK
jgi:hypothetical protein